MTSERIVDVDVATIRGQLPSPVIFGDWVMKHREFVVVRLTSSTGHCGFGFTLTRDGAVAEQVRKSIAPVYLGTNPEEREHTFATAWKRNLASHASGVGLRALSIVDLAAWDLQGQIADQSVADLLGGRLQPMPVTAIIGYPPGDMGPEDVSAQTQLLSAKGWRRFKAPVAATPTESAARLHAARAAAPDAWLGCDGAWTFSDVDSALHFLELADGTDLGWFEDVFPPGDAKLVRELRERTDVPIAMGDEQGGSYYPEALLALDAVDVVRIDLTCMGGITGGRRVLDKCLAAGVAFAPHMFAHVHSQVFSALGHPHVPIEWGVQWTGVDPYADSLAQPFVTDGMMSPLEESAGFGPLINLEWARSQEHDDPEGVLR